MSDQATPVGATRVMVVDDHPMWRDAVERELVDLARVSGGEERLGDLADRDELAMIGSRWDSTGTRRAGENRDQLRRGAHEFTN